jgi:hypothetical protein
MAPPMKATTRRSLLRVWRAMAWPLSSHLALALATGLACGITASHYPDVVSPSYAALLGTFVVYPLMLAIWCYLHRPGGNSR